MMSSLSDLIGAARIPAAEQKQVWLVSRPPVLNFTAEDGHAHLIQCRVLQNLCNTAVKTSKSCSYYTLECNSTSVLYVNVIIVVLEVAYLLQRKPIAR